MYKRQDLNGNGLADIFDPAQGGTAAPTPDANGGDMDWRDTSTETALPLSLVAFEVINENCQNQITWITEQEYSIKEMILEKSLDGVNFEALKTFTAQGATRNVYEFYDDKIDNKLYYRLRIVELNKTESFTNVVSATSDCLGASITVYPNPVGVGSDLNISIEGLRGATEVRVLDDIGRLIYSEQYNFRPDQNLVRLPTERLSSGLLYLQITDGFKSVSTSFVLK